MKTVQSNEGQLHTLEGLAGSVVLLLAITYAFNAFIVTPASDVDPATEINKNVAEDMLEASAENGDLKQLVKHWNTSEGGFINSTTGVHYYEDGDPDPDNLSIGSASSQAFTERGYTYNLEVSFLSESGRGTLTVVENGDPGPSAVTATQTVVLDDDDNVSSAAGPVRMNETTSYPIPKHGDRVYNRAEVRLTVW